MCVWGGGGGFFLRGWGGGGGASERSTAISPLQFIFLFALVVSDVAFVLSWLIPRLPFFWCLWKTLVL